MEFHVEWAIDLDAAGPIEAARLARHMRQARVTMAGHYEVTDNSGVKYFVDLNHSPPRALRVEDGMDG